MLVNVILLALSLLLLVELPANVSLLVNSTLYVSMVWYQSMLGTRSLTASVLAVGFFALAVAYYGLGIEEILPYTGYAIYASFAVCHAVAATFELRDGRRREANALAFVGLASVVALVVSHALKPHVSYIIVPIAVVLVASMAKDKISQRLEWILLERSWRKETQANLPAALRDRDGWVRRYGNVTVRVVTTSEDATAFNEVMRQAYSEIYLGSGLRRDGDVDLRQFHRDLQVDLQAIGRRVALVGFDPDGRPVGTMMIYLDGDGGLPIESDTKLSLARARREFGAIVEIGRFAVVPDRRADSEIVRALLRATGSQCLLRDVTVAFVNALISSYPLYRKLGFLPLTDGPVFDAEFKVDCRPCCINMAKKLVETAGGGGVIDGRFAPLFKRRLDEYLTRTKDVTVRGLPVSRVDDLCAEDVL